MLATREGENSGHCKTHQPTQDAQLYSRQCVASAGCSSIVSFRVMDRKPRISTPAVNDDGMTKFENGR